MRLFPLSLAPFDLWPLAIACLFFFLAVIDVEDRKIIIVRYYLFSLGLYGVGVSWIFVSISVYGGASYFLAGFLVFSFVAFYALTSLVASVIHINISMGIIGFPATLVVLEWFRSWFLTGFPWLFAGYSQLESPLAAYAPIVGVFGLTFLTALTASLLYESLRIRRDVPSEGNDRFTWIVPVVVLFILWAGSFAVASIEWVRPTGEVASVSVIQGNIDQHSKWRRSMVGPIIETYYGLMSEQWGRDIVVWPEAAITLFKNDATQVIDELDRRGKQAGTSLILGIPDRDGQGRFLNSALALGNGSGSYYKRRLVPFGEYVPMEDLLRGLINFFDLPMSHNRSGPANQEPLTASTWKLSMSICYEVVYPELVRLTTMRPDLYVTISNDSWFGRSLGPKQHLQMARMRALENGRWMIRSTNNGLTALIDHQGKVRRSLPGFMPGVLQGDAEIMYGQTPYHRFGHWPILIFSFGLLIVLAVRRFLTGANRG